MSASLADRLQTDLKDAMKARDKVTVSTLRMAIAAVKEEQVAGDQVRPLTDDEVESLLRTQVKRRDEAADAFRAAGRDEQADLELAEREVLARYLPAELTEDELRDIVDRVLTENGYTEPAQMGHAMKAVMSEVEGRADGKAVSAMVRSRLSS